MAVCSPAGSGCRIEDYAIIGDCRTAALVSRAGSIDWLCLPDFSSASVFARLLDPKRGGSCSIRPRGAFAVRRQYVDHTAVLEAEFTTPGGRVRLLDALPIQDGLQPMRPLREVLRLLEGRHGSIDLEVELDLRPDYGRYVSAPCRRPGLGWAFTWRNEMVIVQTDIELRPEDNALRGTFSLTAGERRYLAISYVKGDPAVLTTVGVAADQRLQQTMQWWRDWSARCSYRGPFRDQVIRSAVTLKLLNYAPSGAIVAAPTTSLPEALGNGRNWDYRYCWLRDAGLTNQAFLALGYREEARSFLDWLLHATRLTWPRLRVMYDVFGRTRLKEKQLDHFAGYAGSRPVRIGNGACTQRQLDVYGEVISAADAVVAAGGRLDRADSRMLAGFGSVVCRQWRDPDSGLWEIRGPLRHYTFSKVMCWVALDRLLKLHHGGAIALSDRKLRQFREERTALEDTIEQRGFNAALGTYTGELDGTKVDASLLLMACLGYRQAGESRMRATFDRIQQRLGHCGLIDRYERGYDGFDAPEGAFGICSFWAIDNLAKRGDADEAERTFRRILTFANDVGLYAEEIDVGSGAALGNFPQAFTHVGLINAAVALEAARRRCRS